METNADDSDTKSHEGFKIAIINIFKKIKIFEMIMRIMENIIRELKSLKFFSAKENLIELMLLCHVMNIGKAID